jgi:hypothetical protein
MMAAAAMMMYFFMVLMFLCLVIPGAPGFADRQHPRSAPLIDPL